jgi:hypothetical protein
MFFWTLKGLIFRFKFQKTVFSVLWKKTWSPFLRDVRYQKLEGAFWCCATFTGRGSIYKKPVLWNSNYFLRFRFRFRLLKSYGSGSVSDFWKIMVPVPVPTFEKVQFRFRFQLHIYVYKKQIFLTKFASILHSKLFYKEKDYKYQQIYCKMWKKKMLNEGNQIHNFISRSGSGTVINYGSGSVSDFLTSYGSGSGSSSTRQKVTVPTVPVLVPQHCKKQPISVSKSRFPANDSPCGSMSKAAIVAVMTHVVSLLIWKNIICFHL